MYRYPQISIHDVIQKVKNAVIGRTENKTQKKPVPQKNRNQKHVTEQIIPEKIPNPKIKEIKKEKRISFFLKNKMKNKGQKPDVPSNFLFFWRTGASKTLSNAFSSVCPTCVVELIDFHL